jgi:hypothetical protein
MSLPHFPEPVFFFSGLLYREDLLAQEELNKILGELFSGDGELSFFKLGKADLGHYYEKEMGPKDKLIRLWVCQASLKPRENLLLLKKRANEIEQKTTRIEGTKGRVINIDPGHIALEQVMLATNKPYSHRCYLADGIYTDLVYQFKDKDWSMLPWTYPDYKDLAVKNFFLEQRSILLDHIRKAQDQ